MIIIKNTVSDFCTRTSTTTGCTTVEHNAFFNLSSAVPEPDKWRRRRWRWRYITQKQIYLLTHSIHKTPYVKNAREDLCLNITNKATYTKIRTWIKSVTRMVNGDAAKRKKEKSQRKVQYWVKWWYDKRYWRYGGAALVIWWWDEWWTHVEQNCDFLTHFIKLTYSW